MKTKFNIVYALAIVSILGFLSIVVQAFFNFNLDPWINGLIFVIIGTSLTLLGSIWSLVNIKDGIDKAEIAHILLTVVGGLSIIVGIIELPIAFLNNLYVPAFEGIKATIALFAIIFIGIEAFLVKQ